MEGGSAAVVLAQFEAVNRRDWATAMDLYAEDVELVVPTGLNGGTFRGRDRVGAWFGDWFRTFRGGIHFDFREVRETGDQVALWAHHVARGGQSGIELEQDYFYEYRVRDGKVVYARFCDSWEEALDAIAARESGA
jgi:ketosteroid isomerase-like protein